MEDLLFAFGPYESFIFYSSKGSQWKYHNLPRKFWQVHGSNAPPDRLMARPKSIAFDPHGGWFTKYENPRGQNFYFYTGLPIPLSNWLKEKRSTEKHVSFSSTEHGYYASGSKAGATWNSGTPRNMLLAIEGMKPKHGLPEMTAIGVGNCFYLRYKDGMARWACDTMYPELSTLLGISKDLGGVHFLAMNPYVANQYFLVFKNGRVAFNIPKLWKEKLADVLQDWAMDLKELSGPKDVKAYSTAGSQAGSVASGASGRTIPLNRPEEIRKRELLQIFANGLGVYSSLLNIVIGTTTIVGTVGCTVM